MNARETLVFALLCAPAAAAGEPPESASLEAKVRAREEAFAKTMTDRDLAAFSTFVAEEAVFVGQTPLRGKQAVVEGWKRFYESKEAPFSWKPERVYVLASGTLAMSSGPVFDPKGQRTGTFNSTWRLDPDGEWRVVLDMGCPNICPPAR